MSLDTQPITADQLLRMNAKHCELVKGELIQMAPAGWNHGDHAMSLGAKLRVFVDQQRLGVVFAAETGFLLSRNPDTVRAPDVAFVRASRIPSDRTGFFPGAPDLAVEVISPGDSFNDVDAKVDDYLAAGTLLVWIVNPIRNTVTAYRPNLPPIRHTLGDSISAPDLLPGLSLPISDIFT